MEPTQVCVLGCTHLASDTPESSLATTRKRLIAWAPDAVAVEIVPGGQSYLHSMTDPDWRQQRVASLRIPRKGFDAVEGLHEWTFPQARAAALDPTTPAAQRVIAWLAAFEPFTAALHADGVDLPARVADFLASLPTTGREIGMVALHVARALGHRRLWQFDDFTDVEMSQEQTNRYFEVMLPLYDRAQAEAAAMAQEHAADLWPLWLSLNTEAEMARAEERESGMDLSADAAAVEDVARLHLAGWRSRNLHMAAYLRAVTGRFPGGKVLAIAGASHARPLRAALGVDQHDIELVDVAALA